MTDHDASRDRISALEATERAIAQALADSFDEEAGLRRLRSRIRATATSPRATSEQTSPTSRSVGASAATVHSASGAAEYVDARSPAITLHEGPTNAAGLLGFQPEQVVQEIGYDDDVDQELREAIEEATGTELVDEDYDDVADAVVLWFRDEDGDLTDALVDATTYIEEGGSILLLTPKTGRDGYVEPSDISEAATTAGLSASKSVSAGRDWAASRLVTPSPQRTDVWRSAY